MSEKPKKRTRSEPLSEKKGVSREELEALGFKIVTGKGDGFIIPMGGPVRRKP